jgi:hypothetical protein
MRLRRRKKQPDEGAEPVVRDAEGDPVEDPTVDGILPSLDAAAQEGGEVVPPPPPPPVPEPELEPPAPEPEPVPLEPEPVVAEPEPPTPEPEPEPPAPEPAPPAGRDLIAPEGRGLGRPELLVGAAFVGGVAVAIVLRRLGRR